MINQTKFIMYHHHLPAAPPATFIQHYSALSFAITDHGYRPTTSIIRMVPVHTLRFDDQHELIWSGNSFGHVTSYYGEQLTKYTSFSVGYDDPVLSILTGDFGVLSLLKDELRLRNRRGIPKFSYNSSTFKDMLCMTKLPSELILLGGLSQNLIEFDIERQRQLRSTELDDNEAGCCIVRQHPQFVCCADVGGRITLRNTNNLSIAHTFKTHISQIADFDVHGNYLITCGYPTNRHTSDRFLNVYDLRTFRLVTPIQTIFPPSLLRFVPAFTSKFCLASSHGQFQLLDVAASATENCTAFTHQVQMQPDSSLTALAISSSGQGLAFGDDGGRLHLFGTNINVSFNQYSNPIESADPQIPVPYIDPNDFITPLTFAAQALAYDPHQKSVGDDIKPIEVPVQVGPTPKIEEKILDSMTSRSDVGYAPNPYRNQGHVSYIKGRIGVVGVTDHQQEDSKNEEILKSKEENQSNQDSVTSV